MLCPLKNIDDYNNKFPMPYVKTSFIVKFLMWLDPIYYSIDLALTLIEGSQFK
jgi:hypothetical protein